MGTGWGFWPRWLRCWGGVGGGGAPESRSSGEVGDWRFRFASSIASRNQSEQEYGVGTEAAVVRLVQKRKTTAKTLFMLKFYENKILFRLKKTVQTSFWSAEPRCEFPSVTE